MGLFSKSIVGIDVGTSSLKAIELEQDSGRFSLKNYGMIELERVKEVGQHITHEGIAEALKQLIKESGVKAKVAAASIPSFSTFATVIELPYLSEKDLASALPYEARKYIPIPLEQVVLDWSIISIKKDAVRQKDGQMIPTVEVFLAAVPKEEAERYRIIFDTAGLKLRALELENIALIRSLLGNDLTATAIINVGGRSTTIFIADKGFERISHNYSIGGFGVTHALARSYGVSIERAEQMKRTKGITEEEFSQGGPVVSLIDTMIFEAQKVITNYQNKHKTKVERILVTGGLNNMPGFLSYFKKKNQLPVLPGNPFSRVVYPQGLQPIIPELANSFAVAVGLAMREM